VDVRPLWPEQGRHIYGALEHISWRRFGCSDLYARDFHPSGRSLEAKPLALTLLGFLGEALLARCFGPASVGHRDMTDAPSSLEADQYR
jgi:hypothetical protein